MTERAAPRAMGAWGVGFLALNGMIGAGIFGLPGTLDAAVGGFAPWLLLLAGRAMMGVAWCYVDLAARFDSNGGPQLYASAAFGPFVGFEAGWMNWSSRVAASAANAVVLGDYVAGVAPASPTLVAASAIVLVTLLNLAALRRVVATLGLLSLIKLAPLLLVAGLALANFGVPAAPLPSLSAAQGVLLAALYAFVGFESATVPAGETRDAKTAVPRALLATLALVTAFYVLLQLAYSAAGLGASTAPLAGLAAISLGGWGGALIAITAAVSVFANLSSAFATMPRVTAAMAEQRQVPACFDRRLAGGAPVASVLAYGGVALALAVSGSFVFLAIVSTLARLFVYALCAAAVPILDRARAGLRPVAGGLLPGAVILFCLLAASQSAGREWLTFAAFLGAGALLYGLARTAR